MNNIYTIFGVIGLFGVLIAWRTYRIFRGKKILAQYLEAKDIKWLDIAWSNERPFKYNPLRGKVLMYKVATRTGEMKNFKVGTFWRGLLNPLVSEVE